MILVLKGGEFMDKFLTEILRLRAINEEQLLKCMMKGDSHGCDYANGFGDALVNLTWYVYKIERGEVDV